ncbi:MAG: hypothetical protein V4642_00750 [Bacteroidota bacterium]
MLHACFQLLVDFIEQEDVKIPTDWNHNEEFAQAKREIDELYAWWKQRIKADAEGKIDEIWNKEHFEKDTEMLIRLIKIRKYLWT